MYNIHFISNIWLSSFDQWLCSTESVHNVSSVHFNDFLLIYTLNQGQSFKKRELD